MTFRTAGEIIADMEGSPASGVPGWAIASIGLFFFLGVGFWIYSTNASHTRSVVAAKAVTLVPPAQPLNNPAQTPINPAVIPLESQAGSASGSVNVPAVQEVPAEGKKIPEVKPEVKNEVSPITRVVKKGDNLSRLVQDVYGYSNREVRDEVYLRLKVLTCMLAEI